MPCRELREVGAIPVTWRNITVLVGLIATLATGLVAGTAGMMEWRIDALQRQLTIG